MNIHLLEINNITYSMKEKLLSLFKNYCEDKTHGCTQVADKQLEIYAKMASVSFNEETTNEDVETVFNNWKEVLQGSQQNINAVVGSVVKELKAGQPVPQPTPQPKQPTIQDNPEYKEMFDFYVEQKRKQAVDDFKGKLKVTVSTKLGDKFNDDVYNSMVSLMHIDEGASIDTVTSRFIDSYNAAIKNLVPTGGVPGSAGGGHNETDIEKLFGDVLPK